jgi:hypothetical protein
MERVEQVEAIAPAAFHAAIRQAARPVVLKGLVRDWPAVAAAQAGSRALADHLRRFATAEPAAFAEGDPAFAGRFHYREDLRDVNFARGAAPLGALLDRLLALADAPSPPALAAQGLDMSRWLPGFAAENPLPLLDPRVTPRAWIGNSARVATHNDPLENVACVVAGRRTFTLFPPEQIANLYIGPFHPTPAGTPVSMVHVSDPDVERYPLFAEALAAASVAELEPGDAIYSPYQYYHHVESAGPLTMLVNYWWNDAPAAGGSPWDAMLHGMMALRGLPEDQRRAWRAAFDHYVFLAHGDPGAHLPEAARGILGATGPADLAEMRRTLIRNLMGDRQR